jgi:hypothetical protein
VKGAAVSDWEVMSVFSSCDDTFGFVGIWGIFGAGDLFGFYSGGCLGSLQLDLFG